MGWKDAPVAGDIPAWQSAPELEPERIPKSQFQTQPERPDLSLTGIGDWFFQEGGYDDFKTRLLSGIKTTPKGKREYLESVFGKGNVDLRPRYSREFSDPTASAQAGQPVPQIEGYDIQVRNSTDKPWRTLNTAKFTPADLAEWAAPAAEMAVNVGAAFVPAGQTPSGQALATATGRGVRQIASSMLPGRDYEDPLVEVPVDIAKHTAITYGTNKLIQGGNEVIDWVRNAPARAYLERTGKGVPEGQGGAGYSMFPKQEMEVAKQRDIAFRRQGIQPGYEQVVPTEGAKSWSNAGATSVTGAQRAKDFYNKEAQAAVDKLDDFIGGLGPKVNASDVAGKIESAQTKAFDAVVRNRSASWNTSFSEATKATGGKPFIELPETVNALKEELSRISALESTAQKQIHNATIKELRAMATPVKDKSGNIIDWTPKNLTANDLRALHEKYSSGSFVQTQEAASASNAVSSKLKSSLNNDVNNYTAAMIDQQGTSGAAGALKQAWEDWAKNSARLDKISKTSIGRSLKTQESVGLADETIVDRALKMKPTELRGFLAQLRKYEPETYQRFPQLVLHNARQKAVLNPEGTASEAANFSMEKFLNNLPKDQAAYNMVFRNPSVRQNAQDLQTIFKAYEEAISHGAKRQIITEARTGAGNVASTGENSWIFKARQFVDLIGGHSVSKKMFTKEGINELIKLERISGRAKAIEYLTANAFQKAYQEPSDLENKAAYKIPMVSEYQ